MKPVLAVAMLLSALAGATAVQARPIHHPIHHKQCKWTWVHHHKVHRCW